MKRLGIREFRGMGVKGIRELLPVEVTSDGEVVFKVTRDEVEFSNIKGWNIGCRVSEGELREMEGLFENIPEVIGGWVRKYLEMHGVDKREE